MTAVARNGESAAARALGRIELVLDAIPRCCRRGGPRRDDPRLEQGRRARLCPRIRCRGRPLDQGVLSCGDRRGGRPHRRSRPQRRDVVRRRSQRGEDGTVDWVFAWVACRFATRTGRSWASSERQTTVSRSCICCSKRRPTSTSTSCSPWPWASSAPGGGTRRPASPSGTRRSSASSASSPAASTARSTDGSR